jgi:hypothetical protein
MKFLIELIENDNFKKNNYYKSLKETFLSLEKLHENEEEDYHP